MGMIFLSDEDVDVARIVKCWLVHQPADQQLTLGKVMDTVSPPTSGCVQLFPPMCATAVLSALWAGDGCATHKSPPRRCGPALVLRPM